MNRLVRRLLSGKSGAVFEIRILLRQTARAFGEAPPKSAGLSAPELLNCYARFTAGAARRAITVGREPKELHLRLYRMTLRLGKMLRFLLRPENEQDCADVLILLYRNIGITLSAEGGRAFCVHKCYFSAFYTPEICSVISAIDQGIFAGICGGGTLTFKERITEGNEVCRADLL